MLGQSAQPASKSPNIKDGTDQSFMADVIEASKEQPVIVDFWATWCGPCKTLGPALEKAVDAAGGKVKLVKIDVDKNPGYAGQLRVQSIPTVYAFVDGQPVDGFMGAVPDSQLKTFIDKLTKGMPDEGAEAIEELLSLAADSVANGDAGGAAQAYAQILQVDPKHPKALAGLARVYLNEGDTEQAQQIVDMAEGAKDPDLDSVRAALKLAAAATSETAGLEAKVAANPDDHEARFELAGALAGLGKHAEAIEHLLHIVRADRAWNDEAARKQLLTVFEAAGAGSEASRAGRRQLSSILFS